MEDIHPSLVVGMGGDNRLDPEYQLGEGCLVDQLVGQYVAHICGLGYLVDSANIRATLNSIMKYNYRDNLSDHFNCFRSFALGDEAALLMASYPYTRPENPFPYFTEVMTGFEYTAAVGMLYEGLEEDGLKCIRNIRNRYDGMKRSPFDEAECGHHYGRAMASWSAILAMTGFHYSAVDQRMSFNPLEGKYFWSNGYQYGTVEMKDHGKHKTVSLNLIKGEFTLNSFMLQGYGQAEFANGKFFRPGQPVEFEVEINR
jgi:non-lysosomal glucosylceramidase